MRKIYFFITCTLILSFLFGGLIFNVNNKALAEEKKITYNPDLKWTVSVGESNDVTGSFYAQLDLTWTPPANISSYSTDNDGLFMWYINIYDITSIDNTNQSNHVLGPKEYNYNTTMPVIYKYTPRIGGDDWVGWKKKYKVIVDLRYGKMVYDSLSWKAYHFEAIKTVGSVTKIISTESAPTYNNTSTGTGRCPITNLSWAQSNVPNYIYFTWENPEKCDSFNLKITRPNKSLFPLLNSASRSIADKNAISGEYIFETIDADDKVLGTTKIRVNLEDAILNTSDSPKSPQNSPTAPADTTGSTCSQHCASLAGSTFGGIPVNLKQPLCYMQCMVIDAMAEAIGWMISHILYPALGI